MKEFDIYLTRHLIECDLIINSLPFRDGLSVLDRLVLKTLLEDCKVQKFLAIQSNSQLVSRIDATLKTIHERLNHDVSISSDVSFTKNAIASASDPNIIEMVTREITPLAEKFETVAESINIILLPADTYLKKAIHANGSSIEISDSVNRTSKNIFERPNPSTELTADIKRIEAKISEQGTSIFTVGNNSPGLFYTLFCAGNSALDIISKVRSIDLFRTTGAIKPRFEISAIVGISEKINEAVNAAFEVLSQMTAVLQAFFEPAESSFSVRSSVNVVRRKLRTLAEIDGIGDGSLASIDDFPLSYLDYEDIDE